MPAGRFTTPRARKKYGCPRKARTPVSTYFSGTRAKPKAGAKYLSVTASGWLGQTLVVGLQASQSSTRTWPFVTVVQSTFGAVRATSGVLAAFTPLALSLPALGLGPTLATSAFATGGRVVAKRPAISGEGTSER